VGIGVTVGVGVKVGVGVGQSGVVIKRFPAQL
jgi:hypothetical protein